MTDSKPSKSARKREHHALQELGEQLIELRESELRTVPLDDNLLTAILAAQRIKAHGAMRRQKQLIGKLMGKVDAEPIRTALFRLGAKSRHDKQLFAAAERWRDRLCNEGQDAIDAFNASLQGPDEVLTRLLSELATASNQPVERRLQKLIFRRVHDLLAAQPQDV